MGKTKTLARGVMTADIADSIYERLTDTEDFSIHDMYEVEVDAFIGFDPVTKAWYGHLGERSGWHEFCSIYREKLIEQLEWEAFTFHQ